MEENHLLSSAAVHGIRRGVDTLHLVEDHSLVGQGLVGVLNLVMPSLLLQRRRGEIGVQYRVKVHVDKVVEVLQILTGWEDSALAFSPQARERMHWEKI